MVNWRPAMLAYSSFLIWKKEKEINFDLFCFSVTDADKEDLI